MREIERTLRSFLRREEMRERESDLIDKFFETVEK